ncbi:hypothetical protein BD289DRAFT_453331 [Coniella lustricola]|uniref:Peptidase metallopeptidase domain-containing protein n=1 Tax=Coniella lustricola TaxID=2025994 RepID=A0A2T3A7U6_9PEZI|nr:hypothetical protein BD289DRAFT_453331 [Coniella lustricola]
MAATNEYHNRDHWAPFVWATPVSAEPMESLDDWPEPEPYLVYCTPQSPFCGTETSDGCDSCLAIKVDYPRGEIRRWRSGSTITFNAVVNSFPSRADCEYALCALEEAAKQWNRLNVVTFQRVSHDQAAVFQLVYRQTTSSSQQYYALAFFPTEDCQQRKLTVYDLSFEDDNRDFMSFIFCHELGHILGLRHEFASQEGRPYISIGPGDESSIMNYYKAGDFRKFRISAQDWTMTRHFYQSHVLRFSKPGRYVHGTAEVWEHKIIEIMPLAVAAPLDEIQPDNVQTISLVNTMALQSGSFCVSHSKPPVATTTAIDYRCVLLSYILMLLCLPKRWIGRGWKISLEVQDLVHRKPLSSKFEFSIHSPVPALDEALPA